MKLDMDWRFTRNDLLRSKTTTAVLVIVLTLSAFLMSTGGLIVERLSSSVGQLFDQAKPPHYLQMHKGEYDVEALRRFAAQQPNLEAWLIEEMRTFDGSSLAWQRPSTNESGDFSESLIDNSFVVQNQSFDFLLDQTGQIANPATGEIYVPVAYERKFKLKIDDKLQLTTPQGAWSYTIKGFVRDAQMASSLSSATRFVIADDDFKKLTNVAAGVDEIIAQYRLKPGSDTASLQRAYESDDSLPKNGQAVTYQMIFVINVISEGLAAAAYVFMSVLLVLIAMVNARFIIYNTLEDEVQQIGTLRALGVASKEIKRLYLTKYRLIVATGCLLGVAIATGTITFFTASIQQNFAQADWSVWSYVLPIACVLVVYGIAMGIVRRILKRIDTLQIVSALVHGKLHDDNKKKRKKPAQRSVLRRQFMARARGSRLVALLAVAELGAEMRRWLMVTILFIVVTVMVLLPLNVLVTFKDPQFMTYMGSQRSDVRVDIQFSDAIDELKTTSLAAMEADSEVAHVQAFTNYLYEIDGAEGREVFRAEVGDYRNDTIVYVDGTRPAAGEIALSSLAAEKYATGPGKSITLYDGSSTKRLMVSGIYQDVTSGGYTAKLQQPVLPPGVSYVAYVELKDGVDKAAFASRYNQAYPGIRAIPMEQYTAQTLGYITDSLQVATLVSLALGVSVSLLVVALFVQLRLTKERQKFALLYTIGFTRREMKLQILVKVVLASLTGCMIGMMCVLLFGELLVGGLLSVAGVGLSKFVFLGAQAGMYTIIGVVLVVTACLGTALALRSMQRRSMIDWLKGT